MKNRTKNIIALLVILIALVGIVAAWMWYQDQPGELDGFARCLEEREAIFFGAFWCPHCQSQKKLFGRSEDLLPYVECSTPNRQQTPFCADQEITAYPTWEFADGERRTGTLSLEVLSEKTECPLP